MRIDCYAAGTGGANVMVIVSDIVLKCESCGAELKATVANHCVWVVPCEDCLDTACVAGEKVGARDDS